MDLIERQAAIEALGEKPLAWTEGEYELGLQQQWEADVNAIKALPSAQSAIIRCNDCKHYRPMIDQDDICAYRQMQVFPDDYCSRAERREDG